jgi:hypothetical protein
MWASGGTGTRLLHRVLLTGVALVLCLVAAEDATGCVAARGPPAAVWTRTLLGIQGSYPER